jgi:uncharacterized protein (DUF1800 family)
MRVLRTARLVLSAAAVLAVWTGTESRVQSSQSPVSAVPADPSDTTLVHVLNRIGFGPAPGDVEKVRRVGLATYIDRQLHPETIADAAMAERLGRFSTLTKSTRELADDYFLPALMERRRGRQTEQQEPSMTGDSSQRGTPSPEQAMAMQRARLVLAELTQQKVLRAVHSERQLEEVMVDFWFNHFNVSAAKGQTRLYVTEYERDTIRPRVLGKFRDLLGATAQSPAMLFYLDNWQSGAPEGSTARGRRNPGDAAGMQPGRKRRGAPPATPGSGPVADRPQTPQNRRPRGINENYARELMELHTLGVDGGYTQKDVQEIARAFTGWTIANPRRGGGFHFEARMHDNGEKVVLGHRIAAGGGRRDAEQVLDILAAHPSTARFIATKLARRFVADDPPASLVDRAAMRFGQTGGDIREVVRTIVTSPEFFAPAAYRAKVKTPFEFVASAVRAASIDVPSGMPLVQAMRDLGMPPYQCQPPTGYADRADAWVNAGALLNRMNFAVALTSGRLRGAGRLGTDDSTASRGEIIDQVLAGDLSTSTRTIVAKATEPRQAIALLLGSPEFQRR